MSYQGDVSVAPGAAAVAQRAGGAPARRGRPGAADRPLPAGRRDAEAAARRAARPGHRPRRRRRHAARPRPALHRPVQWRPGQAAARRHRTGRPAPLAGGMVLDAQAAWQIADILAGVRPPEGAPRAASPTRPAPPTATATPGRSASTAAMCSASGSAAPMRLACRACRAMSRPRPCCSRDLPSPASPPCRCAPRLPAPSARSATSCR